MESKILYRSERGPVPEGEYIVPIGEAHIARNGTDLSIVTYGAQVREAQEAAGRLSEEGIEAEILDLRTLKPLDTEAIPGERTQDRQSADRPQRHRQYRRRRGGGGANRAGGL